MFVALFAVCAVVLCQVSAHTVDFNHYWTFSEIEDYLKELEADYPQIGHTETYGTTSEGRTLTAFCIHKHDHKHSDDLPVIFIEAGVRPREWISVMSALYFLHEVVEHHYDYSDLLDNFEFVVIPVANPDGYVFTHATDRLWNKNRRSVGSGCFGTDVNANFRFQFRSGSDPCSPNYPGDFFFSERESFELSNFMSSPKYAGKILGYISLQAFGEQILVPYNYFNIGGGNNAIKITLANTAANAIRGVNPSRNYQVGIGAALNAPQFGTSTDYAKGTRLIEYVFTFRLPRGGTSGFEVPPTQIAGISRETFAGLRALSNAINAL